MTVPLRNAIRNCVPLLSVQLFLAALNASINAMSGATVFWAIYPILGMAIPEVIMIGQALFTEAPAASQVQMHSQAKSKAAAHRFADQVRGYQEELEHRAALLESKARSDRLAALAKQFEGWAEKVEFMEEQVALLKSDALIQHDLRAASESLRDLDERMAREDDARVRRSLEQTMTARRTQLAALEQLASTTRHAEAHLEATVASLGAMYIQALTNLSSNSTADYQHLTAEVDERVRVLQDELAAIEEVRLYDRRSA